VVARLDRGDEFRRAEDAARADLGELHAGVGRRAAGLVPDRVALAADDDVVAGSRQHPQRHLVGHRAAGKPERGLLAEQGGDLVLQPVDRRVFAVLVVADRSGGHRGPHLGRGTGDGIGTKVDGFHADAGRGSLASGRADVHRQRGTKRRGPAAPSHCHKAPSSVSAIVAVSPAATATTLPSSSFGCTPKPSPQTHRLRSARIAAE